MDEFFNWDSEIKSPEVIALENAVTNALNFFAQRDFVNSLPFIAEAIDICERNGIGIPNLFLMQAYAEMETGDLVKALTSIDREILLYPDNYRAIELREHIKDRIEKHS